MFPKLLTATAFAALLSAPAAMAEQYVVQLNTPFEGANASLLEQLKIVEIDTFTYQDAHYIVIEAPGEGQVQAYFVAMNRTPIALHSLRADWTAAGLSGLSVDQQMPFLNAATCTFCAS